MPNMGAFQTFAATLNERPVSGRARRSAGDHDGSNAVVARLAERTSGIALLAFDSGRSTIGQT